MDVYGLIGNPVGHSLSPPMHEAAYEATGVDARYVTFEPPLDAGEAAVEAAQNLGIAGLNVTIPFKEAVLDALTLDPLAERVGAVNTISFAGDRPTGYNTDVTGAIRSFTHHSIPLDGRQVVVVGAGGAGRAIAFGLADAGALVSIVNRTEARAEELAAAIPSASSHGLDALASLVPEADILVNATSVGMEANESPVPADLLHANLVVMDAVYRPLTTKLLRDTAQAGGTCIDGAWMLLFQGAEAFELWTGKNAPIDAMNDALRDLL